MSTAFGSNAADAPTVEARIRSLVTLARNDEACRLLGIDGVLEGQLDVSFLDDPMDWIAYDVAQAIKAADAEEAETAAPTLGTLVAELRLHRLLRGEVDESALSRLVREYVEED